MSFYVDTALQSEAKKAKELGWVRGVTTNPLLIARSGRSAEDVLNSMLDLGFQQIFYQLTSATLDAMQEEAAKAKEIVGQRLVLKIAPTNLGFSALPVLCSVAPCCLTALYSVAQVRIAAELGASYTAIYVNRASRLLAEAANTYCCGADGEVLDRGVRVAGHAVKALLGTSTSVLAASLKSVEEVEAVLAVGVRDATLSYDVLKQLPSHELSRQAVEEFEQEGVGL